MTLLITLAIASVAGGYLRMTLTEEIEALFAGSIVCFSLLLGIIVAPLPLKLVLLAVLLPLYRAYT